MAIPGPPCTQNDGNQRHNPKQMPRKQDDCDAEVQNGNIDPVPLPKKEIILKVENFPFGRDVVLHEKLPFVPFEAHAHQDICQCEKETDSSRQCIE